MWLKNRYHVLASENTQRLNSNKTYHLSMRHIQLQTRQIPRPNTKAFDNKKQLHHQGYIRFRQQSLDPINKPEPKNG